MGFAPVEGGRQNRRMKPIVQSRKLQGVRYDVRGPILVEAQRLEAEGHKILKLNIGNTAPFGFEAPEAIVADMVHNLPDAQGYSDSRGIYSARTAVAQYYQSRGLRDTANEDVFIGNGVAIPHGTNEAKRFVKKTGVVVLQYPDGVDFDGEKAYVLFGIAGKGDEHLQVLAKIAEALSSEEDAAKLAHASSKDEFLKIIG